jgi:hypothetical protein
MSTPAQIGQYIETHIKWDDDDGGAGNIPSDLEPILDKFRKVILDIKFLCFDDYCDKCVIIYTNYNFKFVAKASLNSYALLELETDDDKNPLVRLVPLCPVAEFFKKSSHRDACNNGKTLYINDNDYLMISDPDTYDIPLNIKAHCNYQRGTWPIAYIASLTTNYNHTERDKMAAALFAAMS